MNALILDELRDCDDSTSHATDDCAVAVSASTLAAEMKVAVSLSVG